MRVLLVTNDWPPDVGGIQTYLRGLVDRTSHDVRVLAPAHPDAEGGGREVRNPDGFMWPTRGTARRIADEVQSWDADLVWFGAPHPPALLGPSVADRTGRPYMVLCHGAEVSVAAAIPVVRSRLRRSLREAATVLAVSDYTRGVVERLSGRDALRLGVGVEVGEGPSVARGGGAPTIVSVGRLVPRKGYDRLIDALAQVPTWEGRLLLVGDGPQRRSLERRAARRGVPLEVRSGLDDGEVRAALGGADVFAQPCRTRLLGLDWEGLGIVFLEAAAAGLPVIAGSSGGAPETVRPGVTGYVASSRSVITDAVIALSDPNHASEMGAAGKAFVESEWSWSNVIDRFDRAVEDAART